MQERTRPPRSPTSSLALTLLALLPLTVPLARGGVDAPVILLALLASTAAALLATWSSAEVPWSALALGGVVLVIALQLVPLPARLHAISPSTRAVFETSLGDIGAYPAARPLTLDIPATCAELAKAVACLAAFVAAWTYSDTRRRRTRLLGALGLSAALVAAAVLASSVLGLQPLLAPRFPFVNPNHLAGFLDLTAFFTLGMAVRAKTGQARLSWAMGFAAAVAVLFASLSRGGIAAFFVGLALFGGISLWRRGSHGKRGAAIAAIATAVALGVTAYLALGPVERELATIRTVRDEAKIMQWPAGVQVIRDFPVLGIGRGAFATVFPAYKTDLTVLTFTHLENEWLQPLIDLGVPGGILLIGTFAAIWLIAVRRRDLGPAEVGLLAGAGALAAHEVFDFSLEVLGVALPFSVALGLLARGSRVVAFRPRILRGLLATFAAAGACGVLVSIATRRDPGEDIARAPIEDVPALARRAAELRPGDYLPHAAAGGRLVAEGHCREALPWAARAERFAPGVPEPHLQAARCLGGGASALARREYRLAFLLGRTDVLAEAAERWPKLEDLYQVVPETPEGLLALGDYLEGRSPEDARNVFSRLLEELGDERALLPLARVTLAEGDTDAALELANRRMAEVPGDEEGYRIAVIALDKAGRGDEAKTLLERGLGAVPGSAMLSTLLATRLVGEHRFSEARKIAEGIVIRSPADVAQRELLVAGALAAQGRLPEAIERAQSAAAAMPDSAAPLLSVAQLCIQAGRYADGVAALERAAALPGAQPGAYSTAIADARAKLEAQTARRKDALLRPEEPLPADP